MFSNQKTQRVFEDYKNRERDERNLMQRLGPEGFKRRDEFLLPIGEDVGQFLHSLILAKKPKRLLEIGTSYGYSTLFLADAAQQVSGQLVSLDLADYKQIYAREQIEKAGLSHCVEFRLGDAIQAISSDEGVFDFVLLDIWKELYVPALEALIPKLAPEALIAADNMYRPSVHLEMTRAYRRALNEKTNLQSTLLPIGAGIELTCYWPKGSPKL